MFVELVEERVDARDDLPEIMLALLNLLLLNLLLLIVHKGGVVRSIYD